MSFTDQKPRVATEEQVKARWGGEPNGKNFRCYLCGHKFVVGDVWRWVCSNSVAGNLLVCAKCDGPNLVEKWTKLYAEFMQDKFWSFRG
jgi:hypothetical protein